MVIVKVLKRKDAAALVVGVVVALVVYNLVSAFTADLTDLFSGLRETTADSTYRLSDGWQALYLKPVVAAVLQLLALEALIRLYTSAKDMMAQK